MTAIPATAGAWWKPFELITERMLQPGTGVGYMQFALDFTPLPAIDLQSSGAQRAPKVEQTAGLYLYGHNVEFAWLLLHAADLLGIPRDTYASVVRPIFDQCVRYASTGNTGGLYRGTAEAPPRLKHKQFWQHAEVLVGMLDACCFS